MSTAEILAELPKLKAQERAQVLQRLWELQEKDLQNAGPSEQEKKILDQALAEFERDPNPGTPWREALQAIRSSNH
jgi:hypothetical protein